MYDQKFLDIEQIKQGKVVYIKVIIHNSKNNVVKHVSHFIRYSGCSGYRGIQLYYKSNSGTQLIYQQTSKAYNF